MELKRLKAVFKACKSEEYLPGKTNETLAVVSCQRYQGNLN
jgi:hypothetical protein